MPCRIELVVPGGVEHLEIIVGVFSVIEAINAGIQIIVAPVERIADASRDRRPRFRGPGRHVVAGRKTGLHHPPVVQFDRGDNAGVGERIDAVEQRVGVDIVIRRQLRFDARHGKKAPGPNVHSIGDLRYVQIDVLQHGIESILAILLQQLLTEVAFIHRKAVAGSVEGAQMKSPVYVVCLHGVGQAFDIEHGLIQLNPVGVDVVRRREIRVGRGAEVEAPFEPAIHLDPAVLPSLAIRSRVEGLHERRHVGVGCPDVRRAAIRPIGARERRRVQRRRPATAGRLRSISGRTLPVVGVGAQQPPQKTGLSRGKAEREGQIQSLSGRQFYGDRRGVGEALFNGGQLVRAGREVLDRKGPVGSGDDGPVAAALRLVQ